MFVGHYSAGIALKAAKPQIPLWVLFVAVQAVDIGWGTLMLLGVEKANFVPGLMKAFPLDLYYMPYTHSLTAGLIWALACAALYFFWRKRDGVGAAAVIGLAVLSHWFLDLPMHAPDLPLYGNTLKQGWGLWNYPLAAVALELGLLAGSIALYGRACPEHQARAWKLGGIMALIQLGNTFGPLPPSALAVAASALVAYALFAWGARWVEQKPAAQ
ncbi:MAG: hypothetical protein AABY95_08390 [Pseudomonadota bacterium]